MMFLLFTVMILQMHTTEAGVTSLNLSGNCHYFAEQECKGKSNINDYTECWTKSFEGCSLNGAENQMRMSQNCEIEESLVTENICYMPNICQEVSYTEYNVICSK